MSDPNLIKVHVQLLVQGTYPHTLGYHRFLAIPRVGEVVHITCPDAKERTLLVKAVDHVSEPDGPLVGDAGITLTCKAED